MFVLNCVLLILSFNFCSGLDANFTRQKRIASACGVGSTQLATSLIVGGSTIQKNEFPWKVH
jgi:hypothetical protein